MTHNEPFTEHWVESERARTSMIITPVLGFVGKRVLDVGTCHGGLLDLLKTQGRDVVGVDVDPKYVEWCKSRGHQVSLMPLGGSLPFPDGFFDTVVVSHVLEHVHDSVEFLLDCRRVLRDDGVLIVVVPNAANVRAEATFAIGHVHYYDTTSIFYELRAVGFRPLMVKSDWPLASRFYARTGSVLPLAFGNWASPLQRRLLGLLPPFHLGLNLYAVVRKSKDAGPFGAETALSPR